MNRYLVRMAAAMAAVGSVIGPAAADWPWSSSKCDENKPGCTSRLNNCYDPCWPERYSAVARQEVLAPFAQQVLNGHVINQTIWNHHFEPGTDRLTAAGVEKLDSLVRVRPGPDTKVYLQTARDIAANADTVDKLLATRTDLDNKRAAMVAKFLSQAPQQLPYEIFVHDPTDYGINSTAAGNAYRGQLIGYRGGISGSGGVQTGSGGGQVANTGTTGTTGTGPTGGR